MAFTPHNNLETIDTGTQNWDSSINDNFEHLEKGLTLKAPAGLTLTKSQVVYIDSNGEFQLAIADGSIANRYVGISTTAINRQVDGYCQNSGHHLDANWSWSVGNPLYLSSSVAGGLTQTEPAESIVVGVAIATNEITVRPWLAPKDQDLAVEDGGTGRNTATPYAVLCGGTNATAEHQSVAGLGSSGQVLTSNGADALPTYQNAAGAGSGTLVQTVAAITGAVATGTTVMANGDAIPVITEGDEYFRTVITPNDVNNTLLFNVHVEGALSTAVSLFSMALFQVGITNALVSSHISRDAGVNAWGNGTMVHSMTAGTTSEMTFAVRCGPYAAATFTLNGAGGLREHGGVLTSGVVIQELS
jgi:hypothetical protein